MRSAYRVDVFESERGWGKTHLEYRIFSSKKLAMEYAKSINSENTLSYVPDYYIVAKDPVLVNLDDEDPVAR